MNFFEHQEQARRRTGKMTMLFALAVIAIIAAVYLVFGLVMGFMRAKDQPMSPFSLEAIWDIRLFLAVVVGTILVIAAGSLYKILMLRGGGHVVAEHLGGQLVSPATSKGAERRLINVVEEMAIASGIPAPPVYIMEENAINAFAAGYSPNDAVIGVTRGCVQKLTRDQLQGVVAHEFSHILNGDMRLNIKLIGLIHGIVLIGLIGYGVLRTLAVSGSRSRSRSSNNKNEGGGILVILAIGVGLIVIGAIGTFFGNLIRAAVSRQREYLADSSAVQFTRNPLGISGALKRIGGFSSGSTVSNRNAAEVSHMFFAEGVRSWFGSAFATHPPLADRIKRIDPSFDGHFPDPAAGDAAVAAEISQASDQAWAGLSQLNSHTPVSEGQIAAANEAVHVAQAAPDSQGSGTKGAGQVPSGRSQTTQTTPTMRDHVFQTAVEQIGNPTREHLEYVSKLLMNMPAQLRAAAHDPFGARALVYALLIDKDPQVLAKQRERLESHADQHVCTLTWELQTIIAKLDDVYRLPLIDMLIPTLRDELTSEQYERFHANIIDLIRADDQVDLFEWVLRHVLMRHLLPVFGDAKPDVVQYYTLRGLSEPCSIMLSTLAYSGHLDKDAAAHAVDVGAAALELSDVSILPRDRCGLKAMDRAISTLAQTSPREKKRVVTACAMCIAADKKVTQHEAEVLRAICDSLDCPMPPLLPGQTLV